MLRTVLNWLTFFVVYLAARYVLQALQAPGWAAWIIAALLASLVTWGLERWLQQRLNTP